MKTNGLGATFSRLLVLLMLASAPAMTQVVNLDPASGDVPDLAIIQGPPVPGPGGASLIEFFGLALATGDFNGDGVTDLAISGASPGPAAPFGSVYIFYGGPFVTPSTILMGSVPADVTITASGPSAGSFAWTLAAGDVNGDGIDDLFIGAPGAPAFVGGVPYGGEVRGLLGPLGPVGAVIDITDPATALLIDAVGDSGDDQLGTAITTVDIDGDGHQELAIGAPGTGPGSSSTGAVYVVDFDVFSGPAVTLLPFLPTPGVETLMVGSPTAGLGVSLAAGNLDGLPGEELIVGAPFFGGGDGKVFLFAMTSSGITETGSFAGGTDEFYGFSVGSGDLNGDLVDDLIIGAPGTDAPAFGSIPFRMDAGAVDVLYGPPSVVNVTIYGMKGDPDAISNAPAPTSDVDDPGGLFGSSLATGDTDLDGRDDLVVGAPYEDGTAGFYTGRAWLLQEMAFSAPGSVIDLGVTPGRAATVIIGGDGTPTLAAPELIGDFMGVAVACADLNGDEAADMITAGTNDPFLLTPGKVITMFGSQPLLGAGNLTSAGKVPKVRFPTGAAYPGNPFWTIEFRDAPPSVPALLAVGAPASPPLFYAPTLATIYVDLSLLIPFSTNGAGTGFWGTPLPPLPALVGVTLSFQAGFIDPLLAGSLVVSDAVTVKIL